MEAWFVLSWAREGLNGGSREHGSIKAGNCLTK